MARSIRRFNRAAESTLNTIGVPRLAVLHIVHLHDLRLARVSAELLHDGHQRRAELLELFHRVPHIEDRDRTVNLQGAMEQATWNLTEASPRLLELPEHVVVRCRRKTCWSEIHTECHRHRPHENEP